MPEWRFPLQTDTGLDLSLQKSVPVGDSWMPFGRTIDLTFINQRGEQLDFQVHIE